MKEVFARRNSTNIIEAVNSNIQPLVAVSLVLFSRACNGAEQQGGGLESSARKLATGNWLSLVYHSLVEELSRYSFSALINKEEIVYRSAPTPESLHAW